jgi:hypothetical protein
MQAYGGVKVQHHLVLISTLNGGSWLASGPTYRVLGKNRPSYQTNEWLDFITSLEALQKKGKNSLVSCV